MKYTNVYELPEPVVRAIVNDNYSSGSSDYSITELLAPAKQKYLERLHEDELEQDISDNLIPLFGNAVHMLLEKHAEPKALVEQRFNAPLKLGDATFELSGAVDHYRADTETVSDYKTMGVFGVTRDSFGDWTVTDPNKIRQIQAYAWLLEANGHPVTTLELVCFFKDWSLARTHIPNYPPTAILPVSVTKLGKEDVETFLKERVIAHETARSGHPLDCTAEERWADPPTYAVKKHGHRNAIKGGSKFTSYDAAQDYIDTYFLDPDDHYIDKHETGSRKCKNYCPVNTFCHQYMEELNNGR